MRKEYKESEEGAYLVSYFVSRILAPQLGKSWIHYKTHDVITDPTQVYCYVLELEAPSAGMVCLSEKPPGLDWVKVSRNLVRSICRAHAKLGLLHNDIRAENVFVDPKTCRIALRGYERCLVRPYPGAPEMPWRAPADYGVENDMYQLGILLKEFCPDTQEAQSFISKLLSKDRSWGILDMNYALASAYYHPFLNVNMNIDQKWTPKPPLEFSSDSSAVAMIQKAEMEDIPRVNNSWDQMQIMLVSHVLDYYRASGSLERVKEYVRARGQQDDNLILAMFRIRGDTEKCAAVEADRFSLANWYPERVRVPLDIARFMDIDSRYSNEDVRADLYVVDGKLRPEITSQDQVYRETVSAMVHKLNSPEISQAWSTDAEIENIRHFYLEMIALPWETLTSIGHILNEIETDGRYRISNDQYNWDRIMDELIEPISRYHNKDNPNFRNLGVYPLIRIGPVLPTLDEQTKYLHSLGKFAASLVSGERIEFDIYINRGNGKRLLISV